MYAPADEMKTIAEPSVKCGMHMVARIMFDLTFTSKILSCAPPAAQPKRNESRRRQVWRVAAVMWDKGAHP